MAAVGDLIQELTQNGRVTVTVKATPHAKNNRIEDGDDQYSLRVFVTAAPDDGKANRAVVDLLSDEFEVASSSVKLIRGHTSRTKVFEISTQ